MGRFVVRVLGLSAVIALAASVGVWVVPSTEYEHGPLDGKFFSEQYGTLGFYERHTSRRGWPTVWYVSEIDYAGKGPPPERNDERGDWYPQRMEDLERPEVLTVSRKVRQDFGSGPLAASGVGVGLAAICLATRRYAKGRLAHAGAEKPPA